MYKFYCYDALIKLQKSAKKIFEERFAISDDTYQKILTASNIDSDLLFYAMTQRNKYDVIHADIVDELPLELTCAMQYDKTLYPDEVVFVTADKEVANLANKYFGEDSIIYIK